ncbi:uncharacterized protein [Dysidea avara]
MYKEIVHFLVEEVKQDITTFDQDYQMKIKEMCKTQAVRKNGFQVRDAEGLSKFMVDAKLNGYTIKARYCKVLFSGSSGAGKTSFMNLLLRKNINPRHVSTGLGESRQILVAKKYGMVKLNSNNNNGSFEWVELDFEKEISQLKLHLCQKMHSLGFNSHKNKGMSQDRGTSFQQCSVEDDIASLPMVEVLESCSLDVWDVVTLLDTGGQPQFINMLPAINSSTMVTFIVHKMCGGVKSLTDKVTVTHGNKKGKRSFSSYSMHYTNLELMKILMSLTNDICLRNNCFGDTICATRGDSTSYLSFIGSHADMVTEDEVTEIDDKLASTIFEAKIENVWTIGGECEHLIPVDNTTAGSDTEDENAKIIRSGLAGLLQTRDVFDVPISWIILELEIRKKCQEKNLSYIPYTEVVHMCKDTQISNDEQTIKDALRFHHLLGVLLFFEDVDGMNDYVITDHQWLFDNLTKLVCCTFEGKLIPNNADLEKFKQEGVLSASLISKIGLELGEIKIQFFLNLLMVLGIIAPIEEDIATGIANYFMPIVLPTCLKNDELNKILLQYGDQMICQSAGSKINVCPLLIQFSSATLPRGVFCCLAVQLLQDNLGWTLRRSEKGKRRTFDNLITFRTVSRHCVSLIDRVFYLEIQIRHKDKSVLPIHYEAQNYISTALKKASKKLNLKSSELHYGFWCCECLGKKTHMTKLSQIDPLPTYCDCDHDEETKITESHTVWFQPLQKFSHTMASQSSAQLSNNHDTKENVGTDPTKKPQPEILSQILNELAPIVSSSINLNALIPLLLKHNLLTNDQNYYLANEAIAPSRRAQSLLDILKCKGNGTLQKLLCCLTSEKQHAGHKDIASDLTELLKRHQCNAEMFCSTCNAHLHLLC